MINLPKRPFDNLAISLSGGGYRAATFHLGTLTYLSQVRWNNKSLLERIRILSTVSGGTFTGVKYSTTIKRGESIEDCYRQMYEFISNIDLLKKSLEYLSDDSNWKIGRQRSLINSFASVYHKEFEDEKLGKLWEESPPIHLKEICFNATEFNFAIPFRFQKTELAKDWNGNYNYGFIGNNKIRLPLDYAKEIRLADIIAASSCFPLGFEPINFPNDFIHDPSSILNDQTQLPKKTYDGDIIEYPVGLMDGGIDDNQGIDSVIWAEERMRNYENAIKNYGSDDIKAIDLFIVSDVSSPYMENFIRSESTDIPGLGKYKFGTFKIVGWGLVCIASISGALCFVSQSKISIVTTTLFGVLSIIGALFSFFISDILEIASSKSGIPPFFLQKLNHFSDLTFNTIVNLVTNRVKSAKIMVSDVFMKQIRRFSYSKVYDDPEWKSRLIMNAVYELSETDVKKRGLRQPTLSEALKHPSLPIIESCEKAKKMGTTLWFTKDELIGDKNMLDTLIACGQYTICFNLLEYLEKWIKNPKYVNDYNAYDEDLKKDIDVLYDFLMEHWKKFQIDPYWMVNQCNNSWLKI